MRAFEPTPRQTNFLILLGCAVLGYGLYLRFLVVDAPVLELICAEGPVRAVCSLRKIVTELQALQFFAGLALVSALVHFVRPGLVPFAIGLVAAILGLTVGHAGASAFAAALLIMGFARPLHANRSKPMPVVTRQTTGPASSRTSH